jgi:hypothetical protein
MQIYVYARRAVAATAILLALSANPALLLCAAELPIREVVLYKHGIGYFEREGTVPQGEEARLDFKNSEMNDILKSLVVKDGNGGQIFGIRYDSNASLEDQLKEFPFVIGRGEYLSAFLDTLKGSRLQLKAGDHTAEGVIVGARAIESGTGSDRRVLHEQLTLLLDSGDLSNYDLSAISSIHFLDHGLQSQLKQYLATFARSKARDKRTLYIDTRDSRSRNLRVAYIAPTPIWKSSYRLTLGDVDTKLEGWAIIDNTTDEDWRNTKLSVVSGRPISFVSLLDTPRFAQRRVAELPEDRAAAPVVYGGSVDGRALRADVQPENRAAGTIGGAGSAGGQLNNTLPREAAPAGPVPAGKAFQRTDAASAAESPVEGAAGAALGELFQYSFAEPVTVLRNQSAMLPFLEDKIQARKLLIYSDGHGEHPVNAAEITNSTSKTLDGGPITVYDSGAYAGEALVETIKAGDKRLIGYAIDYGTRVTTSFDSPQQSVREIHAHDGVLEIRYADHQTRTYTVRNVDAKPKTLVVQQEGLRDYNVLSPAPKERTATAYRFEIRLPANGGQTLKVEQERLYADTTAILDTTRSFLLTLIENKQLSPEGRRHLENVAALKARVADIEAQLDTNKSQTTELSGDQARMRQNIETLNRVAGQEDQVRRYSSQLASNEVQLAKLRDENRALTLDKNAVDAQIRSAIRELRF